MPHDLLYFMVHEDDLDDGDAAFVSETAAFLAALREPHGLAILRQLVRVWNVAKERLHRLFIFRSDGRRYAAQGAEAAYEALRHRDGNRGAKDVRIHAHINEAGEGTRSIVGVERGEDQVTRERCVYRRRGDFRISNLADHDDVGVLAQCATQSEGE